MVKNGTYLVYEGSTRWDKGQAQHSDHVKCNDIKDLHMTAAGQLRNCRGLRAGELMKCGKSLP